MQDLISFFAGSCIFLDYHGKKSNPGTHEPVVLFEQLSVFRPHPLIYGVTEVGGVLRQNAVVALAPFVFGEPSLTVGLHPGVSQGDEYMLAFRGVETLDRERVSVSERMLDHSRYLSCCGGSIPRCTCCSTVHPSVGGSEPVEVEVRVLSASFSPGSERIRNASCQQRVRAAPSRSSIVSSFREVTGVDMYIFILLFVSMF